MSSLQSAAPTNRAAARIAKRGRKAGPQPYDFRRPIKLSREHIRTLQICYETYARACATLFTTRLRTVSQVTLVAIEQLTFEEYVAAVANPTMIASVTLEPLPGTVVMDLPLNAAMAIIDHLLGGPGGVQPNRTPTDLELPLLRGLLDRMLAELRYAFHPLIELQPKLGGIEYNPQFVRTYGATEAVVIASFETHIGAEECVSTVCLPFSLILPVLQDEGKSTELSAEEAAIQERIHRNLVGGLETVPLGVAVRFRPVRMRAQDVMDLRPGDVVRLEHLVSVPLAITVNDITFAHAVPGNQGSRLACLVVPEPPKETRP